MDSGMIDPEDRLIFRTIVFIYENNYISVAESVDAQALPPKNGFSREWEEPFSLALRCFQTADRAGRVLVLLPLAQNLI
jgi:hypothetical protein